LGTAEELQGPGDGGDALAPVATVEFDCANNKEAHHISKTGKIRQVLKWFLSFQAGKKCREIVNVYASRSQARTENGKGVLSLGLGSGVEAGPQYISLR